MLEDKEFDIFLAGPAFQAGRYTVACGNNLQGSKRKIWCTCCNIYERGDAGVDMFKKDMYILKGSNIASKMRQDVKSNGKSC